MPPQLTHAGSGDAGPLSPEGKHCGTLAQGTEGRGWEPQRENMKLPCIWRGV